MKNSSSKSSIKSPKTDLRRAVERKKEEERKKKLDKKHKEKQQVVIDFLKSKVFVTAFFSIAVLSLCVSTVIFYNKRVQILEYYTPGFIERPFFEKVNVIAKQEFSKFMNGSSKSADHKLKGFSNFMGKGK